MSKLLFAILLCVILFSCGSSKYYIANDPDFSNLSSLLKKLDKNKNDNADLRKQITASYNSVSARLLNDVEVYQSLTEPDKWDKIINTYHQLNRLSEVTQKSKARNFINPVSYYATLEQEKQKAAAEYYNLGMEKMKAGDKISFREAYELLNKANGYYPGFKDVRRQLDFAWKKSVLNVVINPVTDQSTYYAQMSPNRFGNSFNSDLLQRSLVRDLGGDYSKGAPAKFFTDREAYMARVDVDWITDITWTRLDVPYPLSQTSTVERSKKIEIGKDTLNKPIYKTVSATLKINKRYFTAYGEIECRITDAYTRDNIDLNRYQSQLDWSQSYATFRGDERALTEADLAMIHNNVVLPSREDILMELYKKIYPQLVGGIQRLVRF